MYNKGKIKKYKVSTVTLVLLVILVLAFGLGYFFLCQYMNDNSLRDNAVLLTIKDILIVLLTICGTNLLVSVIVEVKSNNKIFTEFFTQGIISSPEFYKRLKPDERKNMLSTLETVELYDGKDKISEMYDSIKEKMNHHKKDEYYFEKCAYKITVNEEGNYFKKRTSRTLEIQSYKDKVVIPKYLIARIVCNDIPNCLDQDKIEVFIETERDGSLVKLDPNKDLIIKSNNKVGEIQRKNGYTQIIDICLKKDLNLNNRKSNKITINYELLCSKNDKVSVYRTLYPCKLFSVHYSVEPKEKYKLIGNAFGFHEKAANQPNYNDDNEIDVELNDWIFTDDGICVALVEKN